MCYVCDEQGRSSRRGFLSFAASGALAGFALGSFPAFAAGGVATTLTADDALAQLKAGNAQYVAGPELCASQLNAQREHVAKSQAPWATIVSCADSRVPPE